MSGVTRHMSLFFFFFFFVCHGKGVELVGGGSVINGAYPSSLREGVKKTH